MHGRVANGALRAVLVVGDAIELGVVVVTRAGGAAALEGVEVEPHTKVKDLPALEASDGEVPLVPLANA